MLQQSQTALLTLMQQGTGTVVRVWTSTPHEYWDGVCLGTSVAHVLTYNLQSCNNAMSSAHWLVVQRS